jgi:hypothetical protein
MKFFLLVGDVSYLLIILTQSLRLQTDHYMSTALDKITATESLCLSYIFHIPDKQ